MILKNSSLVLRATGAGFLLGLLALAAQAQSGSAAAAGPVEKAKVEQPAINAQAPTSSSPELVLLDTDIGDDIDDAFALGLILRSPELKLLGATSAFGDTEMRARLLDRYLVTTGHRELLIGAGAASEQKNVFTQSGYARGVAARRHAEGWVVFSTQVHAHPGQVTLIAIGPLTNLKQWIERDPATFKLLKRIVVMGGSVRRGYDDPKTGAETKSPSAEWNFLCDPAAAKAVLGSGVPVELMPLDATQIHLPGAALVSILGRGTQLSDQLAILYHQWLSGNEWKLSEPVLYDPLTVATILKPELCQWESLHLDVDEKGYSRPGQGAANAKVCTKSDAKAFLELFTERLDQALPPMIPEVQHESQRPQLAPQNRSPKGV